MATELFPAAALESHVAILGKTGSGKSNLAKVLVERLMADGARICAIDPTGTWWGLRLAPDGKRPSRFQPVIFGGAHADLPVLAAHGAAIAEAIGTASTSAIVDTRLMTVGQRTQFFADFAEGLLRTNRGPLHLVIDEAHLFAPQGRVADPRSAAMLHAANNLVSLGRGNGLRIILISQRPAKLHKDSLTQVETLVAMRLIAPQDRKAIEDWIGEWADPAQGREVVASLPSLPRGDAWIWSPELGVLERRHFPLAATFDSGRPAAEGDGPALAPIDITAIAGRLEAIGKEVLANDPARLRKRIAELEGQMRKAAAAAARTGTTPDPDAIAAAEARGRAAAEAERQRWVEAARERAALFHDRLRSAVRSLNEAIAEDEAASAAIDGPAPAAVAREAAQPDPTRRPIRQPAPPRPAMSPASGDSGTTIATAGALVPAQRRILLALRQLEAIGQAAPEKANVAWFAGASPKSSGYANNLGAMRSAGLIEYPSGGTVALTEAGRAMEPPAAAPTHTELMALIGAKVERAQLRMLEALVEAWPGELTHEELAAAVGSSPTSSGFANNRGRLRSLGLITYPGPGRSRAAEVLFPEGAG